MFQFLRYTPANLQECHILIINFPTACHFKCTQPNYLFVYQILSVHDRHFFIKIQLEAKEKILTARRLFLFSKVTEQKLNIFQNLLPYTFKNPQMD